MKRIDYKSVDALRRDYLAEIGGAVDDAEWRSIRTELIGLGIGFSDGSLPESVAGVLVAGFSQLAEIYVNYVDRGVMNLSPDLHERLKRVFNYDFFDSGKMSGIIRRFFMSHSESLGISTCHYCDMSYINVYGEGIRNILHFLNTATEPQLTEVLKYSDFTIRKIIRARDAHRFVSEEDFDRRIDDGRITYRGVVGKIAAEDKWSSHFDLDHFLDKGACPIVSLSLFNFVPSCTVCNQRIKHSGVPGTEGGLDARRLCYYSPTSISYTFDRDVKLKVKTKSELPLLDYMAHKDECFIDFVCSGKKDYGKLVDFFRLRERYHFHRVEALRLMDLRQRYCRKTNIAEIARLIYGSDSEENQRKVRDDLFQTYFKHDNKRVFGKLYDDVLG